MQVTKELIENDIVATREQLEKLKAAIAQAAGALGVLESIKAYLEKKEEKKGEKSEEKEKEKPSGVKSNRSKN